MRQAETLRVDPSDPVARHVAAGSHGGLLTLERTLNDKGVVRTVITVDETRETIPFFGSTAAVEGWRVCIVDTVDELNPNAANALLKVLEEPPRQSLFFSSARRPRGCCRRFCRAAGNAVCDRSPPVTSSAPRRKPASLAADDPRWPRPPKRRRAASRAR